MLVLVVQATIVQYIKNDFIYTDIFLGTHLTFNSRSLITIILPLDFLYLKENTQATKQLNIKNDNVYTRFPGL